MKRNIQVLLLLFLGVGLLHIALLTDLYLRYVRPGLRPALIASGVLLLVLGAVSAARDGFPFDRARTGRNDGHSGHGHGHGGGGPRIAWLLYVPALTLLFLAPPALGSYTASRDNTEAPKAPKAAAGDSLFPPLPGGGVVPMSLNDFSSRAVWDTGGTLKGRTVRLTGFVTPGHRGAWYVSRLAISCCAADAQVRKVRVHGATAPRPDTWVTVTGTWHPSGRTGTAGASPALDATAVRRVPEPKDPYNDVVATRTGS
ncbi:TIGR03943 family putative permease subunit [Streptomyces coffeae]|uniref:TIGR03943 family protein n=1 Tax=Streptomyces coffeae TaxID=621382 RepID=A0ABS1NB38_9ACTN|nr:TIGR03943 family protein [Streptomyces coffeae]MBL1097296.1 TIGR03943 family protein [Streptomyces coffeae]